MKENQGLMKAESQDEMKTMQEVLYPGAKKESIEMVLAYCRRAKIDPFLKAVHITPINHKTVDSSGKVSWVKKDTVMPGIGLYRIRAERSGVYMGLSETEYGPDVTMDFDGVKVTFPKWCKLSVKKLVQGKIVDFPAHEFWIENYSKESRNSSKPNEIWCKRPYAQLQKCCEAQALRRAFSQTVTQQPTFEEMEGKDSYIVEAPRVSLETSSNPAKSVEDSILSKIKPKEPLLLTSDPAILNQLSFYYCDHEEVKEGVDKYLSKLNLERLDQLTVTQGENLLERIETKYPEFRSNYEFYISQVAQEA